MTVLNACWAAGLLVWAEGGTFESDGGTSEPVTLLVPCAGDVPTPSPEVPLDEPGPEPDGVRERQITAVRLDATAALDLLREPTDPGTGPTHGVGLRYLTALAGFAADLVRRGRVLPWVVAEAPGRARAVWWPLLSGADAARARAFVAAMPDAVRAVSRSGAVVGAAATVVDALDQLVDATVRAANRTAGGRRPRRGRTSSPSTGAVGTAGVVSAWQQALVGEATFPATPEQLDVLREALAEWHRDASGGPVRAWFRLVEPPDDGTVAGPADSPASGTVVDCDQPWRVELGLQAADEPSLAVAADQVWRSREVLTALARYVPEPQETLLAELGRAYRLWPGLEPALRTARPTRVELDAAGAHAFLTDVAPSLAGAGFGVLLPSWWGRKAARVGVRAAASTPSQPGAIATSSRFGQDALVAFRWELALGDEVLTQQEIEALAEAKQPLVRIRGQWVNLDQSRLRAGLDLVAAGERRQLGLGDLLRRVAAGEEDPEDGVPVLGIDADGWLGELLRVGAPEPATAPAGFAGTLRPYQERGLGWLSFLDRLGMGAILADDMGLGKTVQLLALFLADRGASPVPEPAPASGDPDSAPAPASATPEPPAGTPVGPTLLVCPMSLVGNWRRETTRFAPDLRVHIHHGAERPRGKAFETAVATSDLVITTYALVARDAAALRRVPWRRVVLDEAQAVKNAATKAATAVRSLPAGHRIAVTGTPVENRLADLWSLMEFANPGLLGGPQAFRRRFSVPVERHGDPDAAARLRAVTSPFILRRLKTDRTVIADLPDKLEMEVTCTLTREQASLYQAVVDDMMARIAEATGIERRGLVLATMTKLKQVCNHPAQLLRDASSLPGRSGKLARLEETVEEVLAAGERALLFTQFAEFGALLRGHLSSRFGREVLFLHGGVGQRERDQMVTRFQSEGSGAPPLFVLSLKAGGTGLTLTAANHVIHVDRWWNPAVEDQASDRAFRIGQTRTVQVRKLVCAGTLEERISQMIADKRGLAASIVGSGEGWLTELSTEALRDLVSLESGTVVE